jgi:hypothetical protein
MIDRTGRRRTASARPTAGPVTQALPSGPRLHASHHRRPPSRTVMSPAGVPVFGARRWDSRVIIKKPAASTLGIRGLTDAWIKSVTATLLLEASVMQPASFPIHTRLSVSAPVRESQPFEALQVWIRGTQGLFSSKKV